MQDTYASNIPNYSEGQAYVRCEDPAPVAAARQNAFRALKSNSQFLPDSSVYQQITFDNAVYDFGNVYREATSTFRPRECGVYVVSCTVAFVPETAVDNTVYCMLTLNGADTGVQFTSNFCPANQINFINICTTLGLSSADRVQVHCNPSTPGTVLSEYSNFTAALCPFTTLSAC